MKRWGRLTQKQAAALGANRKGGLGFIRLTPHAGIFFDLPKRYQVEDPEETDWDELLKDDAQVTS